jgi:hypothetical protein
VLADGFGTEIARNINLENSICKQTADIFRNWAADCFVNNQLTVL